MRSPAPPRPSGLPRARGDCAAILALLLAILACDEKPNLIVIYTDDQRWDTIADMPALSALAEQGITFDQSFVTTPVCGPSRASLLTGRYASTQGLTLNEGAALEFDPSETIAVRLQEQGYVTAFLGKYLNGYRDLFPAVPPGWSEWRVFRDQIGDLLQNGSLHRDPMFSWNGQPRRVFGYSTDLLADSAVEFIEENASAPFFLLLSFSAPHFPLLPADRHLGLLEGQAPPQPPSLEEEDVSDKPEWIPHDYDRVGVWESWWPRYLEMLLSVDEAVARIVQTLEAQGIDRNTVVLFTSDNGLLMGEHGWIGKGVPYDESLRVPLVIRWPALVRPRRSQAMVLNVDIAPTLAALAGTSIEADGQSLLPFFWGRGKRYARHFFPLEWESTMGLESGYRGFRFRHFKWFVWDDGWREAYRLSTDPYEQEGLRFGRRRDRRPVL
jgi:arylsulfatase A-like enzyme